MPAYRTPLRDMRFLMNEVLDYPAHYQDGPAGHEATPDLVEAVLDAAATYCEEVLSPLNTSGDLEGCHFHDGEVSTPAGFKEAYQQFVDAGWQGLSFPVEFGGQGLPIGLQLIGNYFSEARMLQVAHAYQQETGWHLQASPVAQEGGAA
mgnify:CR=1 FL=1